MLCTTIFGFGHIGKMGVIWCLRGARGVFGTMEARTPGGGSGVVCDTGMGTSDGTVGRASCPPARGASEDAHGYTTNFTRYSLSDTLGQ